ncbi:hypothetical protein ACCS53_38785, partial [Rhizobium ruizarguesonis]
FQCSGGFLHRGCLLFGPLGEIFRGRADFLCTGGDALQALAEGDLTQQIGTPFIPSLEKLRADFNSAVEKLRAAMQKVAQNA